jgi:nucleolar GTP-binding protein
MLAKMQGAKRKRRLEDEDMDVEEAGDGDGDWMDVDGEGETPRKRAKMSSGAVVAAGKRVPRTNRELAGLKDAAVSGYNSQWCCADHLLQQASKALKLRNLGQRPRNLLARAGESDRAIRVKMVC